MLADCQSRHTKGPAIQKVLPGLTRMAENTHEAVCRTVAKFRDNFPKAFIPYTFALVKPFNSLVGIYLQIHPNCMYYMQRWQEERPQPSLVYHYMLGRAHFMATNAEYYTNNCPLSTACFTFNMPGMVFSTDTRVHKTQNSREKSTETFLFVRLWYQVLFLQ
jgi:hypothetical protein